MCAGGSNRGGRGGYIREIRGEAAELCTVKRARVAEGELNQQSGPRKAVKAAGRQENFGVRQGTARTLKGETKKGKKGSASTNGEKYETGSLLVWEGLDTRGNQSG